MKKYVTKYGKELNEEELQDIFRRNTFLAFNENAFELWVYELIDTGKLTVKEGEQ